VRVDGGVVQTAWPSTLIVPLLGLSWPVINFMKVDLPAPFGPSNPVMPFGTTTDTSLRPLTWPYHFERWSAVISARAPSGADAAGSDPAGVAAS